MPNLSVHERQYLRFIQGESPRGSSKASIEEKARDVAVLQTKIDDGRAQLIGPAVVGNDVSEKAKAQLERLAAARKLGTAIISGEKTRIDEIANIHIGDGTVLVDASVYGSTIEGRAEVRDSHVQNSKINGGIISGDSAINDSTLEHCELHAVSAGHATLLLVFGALDGRRITGNMSNSDLSVVADTVYVQQR